MKEITWIETYAVLLVVTCLHKVTVQMSKISHVFRCGQLFCKRLLLLVPCHNYLITYFQTECPPHSTSTVLCLVTMPARSFQSKLLALSLSAPSKNLSRTRR